MFSINPFLILLQWAMGLYNRFYDISLSWVFQWVRKHEFRTRYEMMNIFIWYIGKWNCMQLLVLITCNCVGILRNWWPRVCVLSTVVAVSTNQLSKRQHGWLTNKCCPFRGRGENLNWELVGPPSILRYCISPHEWSQKPTPRLAWFYIWNT